MTDTFFYTKENEPAIGKQVSTPYGVGIVIEIAMRYASVGSQEKTTHIKVQMPFKTCHWFELKEIQVSS